MLDREPGRWLIEELKSTNLSVDGVRPSGYSYERDRRQLLAYCYLWRRLGHGPVGGSLVYVDIETGEEVALEVSFDEDSEREVERRLSRCLAIWRAEKVAGSARQPRRSASPSPIRLPGRSRKS